MILYKYNEKKFKKIVFLIKLSYNKLKHYNMSKITVIEGLDSVGKSTQTKQITNYLDSIGKTWIKVHFPMYGQNEFAKVISMFLRGEFGDVNEVDPLFVATIYAMDRYKFKDKLIEYDNEYDYIILDRYVYSNVAFQGAKYKDKKERSKMIDWIINFEYNTLDLPYADLTLFFDLPISVIKERLESNRTGDDRNYLDGGSDIHEKDLELQSNVRDVYLSLNDENDSYKIVNCVNENGDVLSPEDLFKTYKNLI